MALISAESLERVKQTADIVEVVSAHTDLRRQGARWVGLCPFHEERTPSFSVDAGEKLYHCFGCGVGGDTIKFVEEKEGLELHRRGRAARRPLRGRARAREGGPAGRGAARSSAAASRSCSTAPPPSTPPTSGTPTRRGKARDYLAERGLGEEVLNALRRRLRAQRLGPGPAARPARRLQGRRAARGRAGPARAQRRRVRPLPLPDHVPDPRPPRPHARLRRPGDALRPGRQVRQHRRDRLLPQEPDALRDRPRQSGDREGRAGGRGRGLHRRPRPAPGRDRGGGRGDGDRDHRGAGGGALGHGRGGRARARRRLGRPGGDAARAAGRRRAQDAAAGRGDARRRGPGRDDGRRGRRRALPRPGRGARSSCPPSRSAWCSTGPTPPRPPSATGRSARWRRSSPRWGRAPAATTSCGGSPSGSTSSRRW